MWDWAFAGWEAELPAETLFLSNSRFPFLHLEQAIPGLRHVTRVPGEMRPPRGMGESVRLEQVPGPGTDFHDLADGFLRDGALARHLAPRQPDDRGCVTFMAGPGTEALARANGLRWFNLAHPLYARLANRFVATGLAAGTGLPTIEHVIGGFASFRALQVATRHLGEALVVQAADGYAGQTTHFIAGAEDWDRAFGAAARPVPLKAMRRIDCVELAVEACVVTGGTLVGPLMTEIVGVEGLTANRATWCGNEIALRVIPADVHRAARAQTQVLGDALAALGYRGMFEVDYLYEPATGQVHFGELNPRFSGAGTVSNCHLMSAGLPPLALFHVLAFAAPWREVEVARLNARIAAGEGEVISQVILRNLGGAARFGRVPPEGRVGERGFFLPEVQLGDRVAPEAEIGSLLWSGEEVMRPGRHLRPEAGQVLAGLRAGFDRDGESG